MGRQLKYDIPGPDWRRGLDEIREKGWGELLDSLPGTGVPLVIDVGFGRGEFLVDQAACHADRAFIGVEYSKKRVLKFARRLARTELSNIRIVDAMAETFVREGLAPGSVDAFWINFPDPWPKARHARRRLVQPAFVALLADRLRPHGAVYVATDSRPYALQIHDCLSGEVRLVNRYASAWRADVEGRTPTAYEQAWRAEGRSMHFFAYGLKGPDE